MSNVNTGLSKVENKSARKLIAVIDEFRKHDDQMQANQMALFLHIGAMPGLTIKEYAVRAGIPDGGPTTRNMDGLAPERKLKKDGVYKIEPGLNLIRFETDAMDRRIKRCYLTVKGQHAYNEILKSYGA